MRIVKKDIHKQSERKDMSGATDRANDNSHASLWQFNICKKNILSYQKVKNESFFNILYSNVDGLLNKKDELLNIIEKDQPMIIALTEIKPRRLCNFNIAEYNIPGYTLLVNNKIKRGVAIYAHVSLNAQLFNTLNDSGFEELVWCQFSTLNNIQTANTSISHKH